MSRLLLTVAAGLSFTLGCLVGQEMQRGTFDRAKEQQIKELREDVHFWMKRRQDAEK